MKLLDFPKDLKLTLKVAIYRFQVPVKSVFEFQGEVFAIIKHKSNQYKPARYFCMHVKTGMKFGAGETTVLICFENQSKFLRQLPEGVLQKAIAGQNEFNTLTFLEK